VYIVFPARPVAWVALAGQDVVLHPSAARFLASFRELVRDFPSAMAEKPR
jgi:hypothetical protein